MLFTSRNHILVSVFTSALLLSLYFSSIDIAFGPSSGGQITDDVKITKSISDDKFVPGRPAIVTVSINSNLSAHIKSVSFTDIVPPMFLAEPKELFSNNVLTKQISPFEKKNVIIYVITPGKGLELSKNWTFSLSSAKVTYKIDNSSGTLTKYSNSPSVTLIAKVETKEDWINAYWTLYLFILFVIATGLAALGGAVSNFIKYRSQTGGIISNVIRENNDYVFEVEYENFIELISNCNIKIMSYAKNPPAVGLPPETICHLYCKNKAIHSFNIRVGKDRDNPLESKTKHPVTAEDAYWKLELNGLEPIDIIIEKRKLSRDILSGFASGFITLLFLIVTTNLVSNNTYPANLVSITTLSVSAFIAGFIPLQIIDKATGQLQERIKISNAALSDQNNENTKVRAKLAKSVLKGTELAAHVEQLPAVMPATLAADPNLTAAVQRARDFKNFLQNL